MAKASLASATASAANSTSRLLIGYSLFLLGSKGKGA
jgi:hypothetical protein